MKVVLTSVGIDISLFASISNPVRWATENIENISMSYMTQNGYFLAALCKCSHKVLQSPVWRFQIRSHSDYPGKGPSIYYVHTEGEGVRLRWTHVDGGEGV